MSHPKKSVQNLPSDPEWHKQGSNQPYASDSQAAMRMPVVSKSKVLVKRAASDFDDSEIPNLSLKSFDKRKPKNPYHMAEEEYNRVAKIRLGSEQSQNSFDPRDKIKGVDKKQIAIRPYSNKIDRFGRIAFNKNKELSQASFESD